MSEIKQKYAILGYPLAHSLSPGIHNAAFSDWKIKAFYERRPIPPADFSQTIQKLKKESWGGFNVTIPFKQRIIPFLDRIDPLAEKIGAVNTIKVDKLGRWVGFNTDYIGFLKPLEVHAKSIHSCLIIGSGGVARAVAFGILDTITPKSLTILNRTAAKAKNLIDSLRKYKAIHYKYGSLDYGSKQKYDLIVNATSVGMTGFENDVPIEIADKVSKSTIVYEIIYKPLQTPLLKKASSMGLITFNGWPMLIYQAEAAFKIWTGKPYSSELLYSLLNKF